MSVEKPATLAKVPISRNSGTVARSALESTPVGSLTSNVTAGAPARLHREADNADDDHREADGHLQEHQHEQRADTQPADFKCSHGANAPPACGAGAVPRTMADVERDDDALHRGRDPENYAASIPERRCRDFQHIGALAGQHEFAGIDPELPRHEPKHDGHDGVSQHIEQAAERRA